LYGNTTDYEAAKKDFKKLQRKGFSLFLITQMVRKSVLKMSQINPKKEILIILHLYFAYV
jgi:hypothetical protein